MLTRRKEIQSRPKSNPLGLDQEINQGEKPTDPDIHQDEQFHRLGGQECSPFLHADAGCRSSPG